MVTVPSFAVVVVVTHPLKDRQSAIQQTSHAAVRMADFMLGDNRSE